MPDRYLQRNDHGEVVGHYSHPHPYALEAVPEDHPEILKWHEKIRAAKEEYRKRKAALAPEKLLARIEALEAKVFGGDRG